MQEKTNSLLTISLPSSLLMRIEAKAKENEQTVSAYLRSLMAEIFKQQEDGQLDGN